VDDIEIEGADGGAVEDAADTADDDELDAVLGERRKDGSPRSVGSWVRTASIIAQPPWRVDAVGIVPAFPSGSRLAAA